jgi:hypothetical protein
MKFTKLICGLSLILSSCSQHPDNLIRTIEADINQVARLPLQSLTDRIEFVRLETSKDFLISSISKIVFHGQRIYILDVQSQKVFCFDRSGKGIFCINSKGKGPGEYVAVQDIAINNSNNTLELLDRYNLHLLQYDLDGRFIKNQRLPLETSFFAVSNKGRYLLYNQFINQSLRPEYQHSLFFSTLKDTVFSGVLPFYHNCERLTTHWPLSKCGDLITFYSGYLDTIYEFEDERINKYFVDFKNYGIPMNKLVKTLDLEAGNEITKLYNHIAVKSAFSDANRIYFEISKDGLKGLPSVLYNKRTQKSLVFYQLEDNIDGLPSGDVEGFFEGSLIVIHEAIDLIKVPKIVSDTYGSLKGLNENDNPVIGFYHLK